MTTSHPSFEILLDLAEGRDVSGDVRAHVDGCATCRPLAASAEALIAAMENARQLDEVPSNTRSAAMHAIRGELGRIANARPHVLESFLRRLGDEARVLLAGLAGDSLQPSAATRSGGATAAPRMLLYETDGYEITVALSRAERGTLDVSGQVTPMSGDLPDGGVVGLRVGDHTDQTSLSELGDFAFRSVPGGELELEVGVGMSLIRLAAIPGSANA